MREEEVWQQRSVQCLSVKRYSKEHTLMGVTSPLLTSHQAADSSGSVCMYVPLIFQGIIPLEQEDEPVDLPQLSKRALIQTVELFNL